MPDGAPLASFLAGIDRSGCSSSPASGSTRRSGILESRCLVAGNSEESNRSPHCANRIRMTNEEPTALAHTTGSDRILNQIIVDLKLRRLQINQKGLVFIEEIVHRLAQ